MAKALMILGTASDVGKSVIAAGLCRLFRRAGIRVAPFKAQNMSLNSYVTPEGGEIGWAQAAQARACAIEPTVDMNPVLLKPVSDSESQVIVQGKVRGTMPIGEYYKAERTIRRKIEQSYRRLSRAFDLVVLEGAGGAAEINLRRHDLVNFHMARLARADVLLVGDIERGGVFASLIGTLDLLTRRERGLVKGLIVNKFRGDAALLKGGLRFLRRRSALPVLGVLPYYDALRIPEEDSVALERKKREETPFTPRTVNVAVIALPHMANFTDFAELEREPHVSLRYVTRRENLADADVVILPGTKNTLGDLAWLRTEGWTREVLAYSKAGGRVVGICGGYQILGEEVVDPLGLEGGRKRGRGLGLLPIRTRLERAKITGRVAARYRHPGSSGTVAGYEIHMGRTEILKPIAPAFTIVDRGGRNVEEADGAAGEERRIWGTYLHGIFADAEFRRSWLDRLFRDKRIRRQNRRTAEADPYDAWANYVGERLDMDRIFDLIGTKMPKKKSATAEGPWPSALY